MRLQRASFTGDAFLPASNWLAFLLPVRSECVVSNIFSKNCGGGFFVIGKVDYKKVRKRKAVVKKVSFARDG